MIESSVLFVRCGAFLTSHKLAANGLHLKIQIISDNGIDEFGYGEKTVFLNDDASAQ